MNGELIDVHDARWAAFLTDASHDFYHLPEYVRLTARQESGTGSAVLVEDADRGWLLPIIVRAISGGGADATSPYGYSGPITRGDDDSGFRQSAARVAVETLRQHGLVSLFVRSHPLLNPDPPPLGEAVHAGDTVSVDLRLSEDEMWRQTTSGHRNQINRARRAAYEAWMDREWEHFDAFKRLYRETMDRRSAGSFYFFDDAYFEDLRAALRDHVSLWVVTSAEGALAAAALFVETDGIIQYHLSAAHPRFSRDSPTKLLLHTVRSWGREHGHRTLHLGGGVGAADDSLLKFKAGFSPLRHPYYTVRSVLDPHAYDRLSKGSTRADVRDVDGFFPAYRAPR